MSAWGSDWSLVQGLRMHARFRLSPEPRGVVVLVHGLLVSSRYMVPLGDELAEDFDVWAPDMPGFGRSEKPGEALDVGALGDVLAGWLRTRRLSEAIVVANSFGCQYAVDCLARHDVRARACVLAGPTVDPARRGAIEQASRWLVNAPFEPWSLGLVLARDLVDAGVVRVAATYRHALRDRIEDKLPSVVVPTVVVRGGADPLVVQEWAEQAARLLPDGRVEVVDRAPHTINYNAPAAVGEVVRSLA